MKKTLMLLTLLFTTSLSLSAQSLDGTWRCYLDDPDDPNGQFWYYTFSGASKLSWKMTKRFEDEEIGQIDFSFDLPCTYNRTGNTITITPNVNKMTLNIDRTSWKRDILMLFHQNPGLEEQMKAELMKGLEANKAEMAEALGNSYVLTVIDFTENTLMVKEGESTLTFVRYNL